MRTVPFQPLDPAQMKVGRRLSIKLLNASKFVLGRSEPRGAIVHPIDVGLLTNLAALVRDATGRLENDYDYAWVLQHAEAFFWDFCDNYLELVKSRRYGDFGEAAAAANSTASARDAACRSASAGCSACARSPPQRTITRSRKAPADRLRSDFFLRIAASTSVVFT